MKYFVVFIAIIAFQFVSVSPAPEPGLLDGLISGVGGIVGGVVDLVGNLLSGVINLLRGLLTSSQRLNVDNAALGTRNEFDDIIRDARYIDRAIADEDLDDAIRAVRDIAVQLVTIIESTNPKTPARYLDQITKSLEDGLVELYKRVRVVITIANEKVRPKLNDEDSVALNKIVYRVVRATDRVGNAVRTELYLIKLAGLYKKELTEDVSKLVVNAGANFDRLSSSLAASWALGSVVLEAQVDRAIIELFEITNNVLTLTDSLTEEDLTPEGRATITATLKTALASTADAVKKVLSRISTIRPSLSEEGKVAIDKVSDSVVVAGAASSYSIQDHLSAIGYYDIYRDEEKYPEGEAAATFNKFSVIIEDAKKIDPIVTRSKLDRAIGAVQGTAVRLQTILANINEEPVAAVSSNLRAGLESLIDMIKGVTTIAKDDVRPNLSDEKNTAVNKIIDRVVEAADEVAKIVEAGIYMRELRPLYQKELTEDVAKADLSAADNFDRLSTSLAASWAVGSQVLEGEVDRAIIGLFEVSNEILTLTDSINEVVITYDNNRQVIPKTLQDGIASITKAVKEVSSRISAIRPNLSEENKVAINEVEDSVVNIGGAQISTARSSITDVLLFDDYWKEEQTSKTYLVISEKKNWYDAQTTCREQGMELATVASEEENAKLLGQLLEASGGAETYFWIGGTDQGDPGKWYWDIKGTMEYVTYTNWAPNEPEHYASCLKMGSDGKWGDEWCGDPPMVFACESRV